MSHTSFQGNGRFNDFFFLKINHYIYKAILAGECKISVWEATLSSATSLFKLEIHIDSTHSSNTKWEPIVTTPVRR